MNTKELRTSEGTVITISPKAVNMGQAVESSPDGKLIQYRTDVHQEGIVNERLRNIWTAMFGPEDAESLLRQFRKGE